MKFVRWFSLGLSCVLLCVVAFPLRAEEKPAKGYRQIVVTRQKELIKDLIAYMQQNPMADDYVAAGKYLLSNAASSSLEGDVTDVAEEFVKRTDLDAETLHLAKFVLCLGLAKTDRIDDSAAVFEGLVRGVRPQAAEVMLGIAHQLSAQARLQGKKEVAIEFYRRVSDAFPLSNFVSQVAETRMDKIALMGKPCPAVMGKDIEGGDVDLTTLQGKVVIVDFWGTNCPPCIEEFPNMRAVYKDFHEQGLEIIGIANDARTSDVSEFQQRMKLPWKMLLKEEVKDNVAERFNVVMLPSLFLVNRKGKIVNVDVYGDNLRAAVEQVMKEAP